MGTHLKAGQRAQLEAGLLQRQAQIESRVAELSGGLTRAERAHELLEQSTDDAPGRENERGLDLAIIGIEERELAAIKQALARLRAGDYGICVDCEGAIPFGRLQVEPWALRCVKCEGAREAAGR